MVHKYKLDFEGEDEELIKVILEIIQRDKDKYHPLSIFLEKKEGKKICWDCRRWYFECTCNSSFDHPLNLEDWHDPKNLCSKPVKILYALELEDFRFSKRDEVKIQAKLRPTKQIPLSTFGQKGLVEYFIEISTKYPHIIRLYGWGDEPENMFCFSFLGGKVVHKTLPKPEESDFI